VRSGAVAQSDTGGAAPPNDVAPPDVPPVAVVPPDGDAPPEDVVPTDGDAPPDAVAPPDVDVPPDRPVLVRPPTPPELVAPLLPALAVTPPPVVPPAPTVVPPPGVAPPSRDAPPVVGGNPDAPPVPATPPARWAPVFWPQDSTILDRRTAPISKKRIMPSPHIPADSLRPHKEDRWPARVRTGLTGASVGALSVRCVSDSKGGLRRRTLPLRTATATDPSDRPRVPARRT